MIRGTGLPQGHVPQGQEPLRDITDVTRGDRQPFPPHLPVTHSCALRFQPQTQLPACWRSGPQHGAGDHMLGQRRSPHHQHLDPGDQGQGGTEQGSGSLRESFELGSKTRAAPCPSQQVP